MMTRLEEILRCSHCGFRIRGYPSHYVSRRAVPCPHCGRETPLSLEDRIRLMRLEAATAADEPAPASRAAREGAAMVGPWLPFPPANWAGVPQGRGVYMLADGAETILLIATAPHLRQALQALAASPPVPISDLATHLWVEAAEEPERRRAELIGAFRAQRGTFPPCNRRHPRYPARLRAWWKIQGAWKRLPAETVDVSSLGIQLTLEEPPAPGAGVQVRVETPLGWVKALGRIAWTGAEAEAHRAGVALTRLQGAGDRDRWDWLINQLAARVAHA